MNLYNYLFFKLYKFAKSIGIVDATWTAMLLITALVYFNVMSVGFFLIGKDFIKLSPNIIGIGAGLLIGVINYFLFIRNYSCITIIKKFQSQPSKNIQLYAQEFNDNNF